MHTPNNTDAGVYNTVFLAVPTVDVRFANWHVVKERTETTACALLRLFVLSMAHAVMVPTIESQHIQGSSKLLLDYVFRCFEIRNISFIFLLLHLFSDFSLNFSKVSIH